MDDHGVGKKLAQGIAALLVLLNDLDFDLCVRQGLGQIVGQLAASHEHGGLYRIVFNACLLEKLGPGSPGTDKRELIPGLDDKVSVRDHHILAPLHGADKDVGFQPVIYIHNPHMI